MPPAMYRLTILCLVAWTLALGRAVSARSARAPLGLALNACPPSWGLGPALARGSRGHRRSLRLRAFPRASLAAAINEGAPLFPLGTICSPPFGRWVQWLCYPARALVPPGLALLAGQSCPAGLFWQFGAGRRGHPPRRKTDILRNTSVALRSFAKSALLRNCARFWRARGGALRDIHALLSTIVRPPAETCNTPGNIGRKVGNFVLIEGGNRVPALRFRRQLS